LGIAIQCHLQTGRFLLSFLIIGRQALAEQRLIVAIGRIERALSRLEQVPQSLPAKADEDLSNRHEKLKAETRAAIGEIDRILAGAA
jgi:hypothetical protein